MEVLCGIDIIEVDRINKNLNKREFRNKVYTEKEIAYCEARKLQAAESYAARFAVKEAFSKAIGTGITEGISLKDIEVIRTRCDQLIDERFRISGFWNFQKQI